MKRLKIMLTAIAVLGVAGGLLAFKAKRASFICTRSTVNGVCPANAQCPNYTEGNINASAPIKCYVTTEEDGDCAKNSPNCNQTARFAAE